VRARWRKQFAGFGGRSGERLAALSDTHTTNTPPTTSSREVRCQLLELGEHAAARPRPAAFMPLVGMPAEGRTSGGVLCGVSGELGTGRPRHAWRDPPFDAPARFEPPRVASVCGVVVSLWRREAPGGTRPLSTASPGAWRTGPPRGRATGAGRALRVREETYSGRQALRGPGWERAPGRARAPQLRPPSRCVCPCCRPTAGRRPGGHRRKTTTRSTAREFDVAGRADDDT